jgi:PTH1 family peptidyl-tRNA hydrolase
VVGLGNPGPRYAGTRHNVGFRVVERLAERHRLRLDQERFLGRFGRGFVGHEQVALLQPQTYMNASGESVLAALEGLGIDSIDRDLVVVYDDVDLPLARLRLRPSGSAGGHNGMRDIIELLGRQDFARLRFGVGRSEGDSSTTAHVLARFSAAEEAVVGQAVERAAQALETLLAEGVAVAMNRFNPAPE